MKRTISILLTALVAFGCAKEELAVLETSGNTEVSSGIGVSPINFAIKNGLENWGTKASVVDGFAVNDAVTVAAFQDNEECFNDAITKTTTGGWVMSEGSHYYWESYNAEYNGTDALDFCFVYPEQTISNKSFTYTLEANPADQKDLLVKYLAGTKASADYSPVEVVMDHALSLLAFEAIAEESGEEYQVEGITISNESGFSNSGTYDFGSGSDGGWKDRSGSINSIVSPIKNSTVTSESFTDINGGDYCFLLPQDVSSMDIHVSYSVEKSGAKYTDTKIVNLLENTFEAGKKYTYRVMLPTLPASSKIKLTKPIVWASAISKTSVTFEWKCIEEENDYVQGYDVYYKIGSKPDISTTEPNLGNTTDKRLTINGLSNKSTCYIVVVAKPKANEDNYVASDPQMVSAMTGNSVLDKPYVSGAEKGIDYIVFTWNAVSNAKEYILTNKVTGEPLGTVTATSYKWSGLNSGTEYTIGVVAVPNSPSMANSPEGVASYSTKPRAALPEIKSNIATETSITIEWDAVTLPAGVGSAYYQISFNPDEFSGNITNTTTTILGLEPDTWYDVYVRTVYDHGEYEPSEPVKIRVKTEAASQNLFYGSISSNTCVEIREGSTEYAILMNTSTSGLKVTYFFDSSGTTIALRNGYHEPLANATIDYPGDTSVHSTNISIDGDIRQNIVDHNNFMKIDVPWNGHIIKIEYY